MLEASFELKTPIPRGCLTKILEAILWAHLSWGGLAEACINRNTQNVKTHIGLATEHGVGESVIVCKRWVRWGKIMEKGPLNSTEASGGTGLGKASNSSRQCHASIGHKYSILG